MPSVGRSTPKRSTKDALLDATERVIVEQGIGCVTTRRVVGEAGVNQALVHYHFGSVDNLMVATLSRVLEQAIRQLLRMMEGPEPFLVKWRRSIEQGVDEGTRSGWSKLWLEITALAMNRPEMRELYVAYTYESRSIYRQAMVDELRAEGQVEDEASVQAFVTFLSALTQGMIMESLIGPRLQFGKHTSNLEGAFEHEVLDTYLKMVSSGERAMPRFEA